MALDIECAEGNKTRHETVKVSEREPPFTFKLDRKPQRVRLDPDEWLLKVATLKEE